MAARVSAGAGAHSVSPRMNGTTSSAGAEPAASEVETSWQVGQRVQAVWSGNGHYYGATIKEVGESKVVVDWDDQESSHREVPLNMLELASEAGEFAPWSFRKIAQQAVVQDTKTKGRCLFANDHYSPGQVIFVEAPTLVALPSTAPAIFSKLKQIHEEQPLALGTCSFYYAALASLLVLDDSAMDVLMDKWIPDPDEDPSDDVRRIVQLMEKEIAEGSYRVNTVNPKLYQRLVSTWRYNSFGHHTEDALVLYNRISMCSHSCDPTCCWSYGDNDAFVLRARVTLDKGSEITLSYLQDDDLLQSTVHRQQKLQNWLFTCACPRCSLEVDTGRGFLCRRCALGSWFFNTKTKGLETCNVCSGNATEEEVTTLLGCEDEYVTRVENLDKKDLEDILAVHNAAVAFFRQHWVVFVLDTLLWDIYRETDKLADGIEHQHRRMLFHQQHYNRPTFVLAWIHEELGDIAANRWPERAWQYHVEYKAALSMLQILCGGQHAYTISPLTKLTAAQNKAAQAREAPTEVQ